MKVNAIEGYRVKNLTFESKKGKPTSSHHSTSPMKTVPVIVLMAMSPMNAPLMNAKPVVSAEPQTEISAKQEKVLADVTYENATPDGKVCKIRYISNDDNDEDFEKLIIEFPLKEYKSIKTKSGENVLTSQYTSTTISPNALKKITYKDKYGIYPDEIKYYIVGPAKTYASPIKNEKTNEIISTEKASSKQYDNYSFQISQNLYNDLEELFGGAIEQITEEYSVVF